MNKKVLGKHYLVAMAVASILSGNASAAPLYPDIPSDHWASEAVNSLKSRGILQSTVFQGDRAATRYEVATMLARTLGYGELEKAVLDAEFITLLEASALELGALSLETRIVEEQVKGLDQRLTSLEQLQFYGELAAHTTFQSFQNKNYEGPNTSIPQDRISGRPLLNGTGFTMAGLLGLNTNLGKNWDLNVEFGLFSSQGNAGVDPYWGLQAPYTANPWTQGGFNQDVMNHSPFSRVVLDNIRLEHAPSNTGIVMGSFSDTSFSPLALGGQPNPSVYGDAYLPFYGVDIQGGWDFSSDAQLNWEAMLTRIPQGGLSPSVNVDFSLAGPGDIFPEYENASLDYYAYGANLAYETKDWYLKGDYVRAFSDQNEADFDQPIGVNGGGVPVSFGYQDPFLVNPNLMDPSDTEIWAFSGAFAWDWEHFGGFIASGEFGFSDASIYARDFSPAFLQPETSQEFSDSGTAFRLGLEGFFFDDTLSLGIDYVDVDASYDPLGNGFSSVSGSGLFNPYPFIQRASGVWFLHNSGYYPQNRQGFRANGSWSFAEERGLLKANASWLKQKDQHEYSLYFDGLLNLTAVDHYESFFFQDQVFAPLGDGTTALPVGTADLGTVTNYGLHAGYDFGKLGAEFGAQLYQYRREATNSVNSVDLDAQVYHFELNYDFSDNVNLYGGVDLALQRGFSNPAGYGYVLGGPILTSWAPERGDNIDQTQTTPYIGLAWDLSDSLKLDTDFKLYNLTSDIENYSVGGFYPASPVEFEGYQFNTTLRFDF